MVTPMARVYLYASPEEYDQVKALGANWDSHSKRWYIDGDMVSSRFAQWMSADEEAEFGIVCDAALVASARTVCAQCGESIEVIAVYCETGMDTETDEPLRWCTLSNIWAMDRALATQLSRWPNFKKVLGVGDADFFANHCAHCGAVQEEYLLHEEPGDVFFGLSPEEPGGIKFSRLSGAVQASGDYSFGV